MTSSVSGILSKALLTLSFVSFSLILRYNDNQATLDPSLQSVPKNVRRLEEKAAPIVKPKLEPGLSELINEPLRSKHPKWKLWHEMNEQEQGEALEKAGFYLKKYGDLITNNGKKKRGKVNHGSCELIEVGLHGNHQLCGPKPAEGEPCNFLSFGINDDPSFDKDLGETWGCRGFAGDPTVHHPSKLHPRVTFHNIGASMLSDNEEREINKGGNEEWWTTTMPKLKDFLHMDHINILKLDCEGCEVAFARDILAEDPRFLFHVDQISLETHVSKTWVKTTEEAYYFALHFALLEEAGFEMEWSNIFGCSKRHEVMGCVPEFAQFGYPCGYDPWPGKSNVVLGYSCHDFLWRRHPQKADKSVLVQ